MANWIRVLAEFDKQPADWSEIHEIFAGVGCGGTVEHGTPIAMSAYVYEDSQSDSTIEALTRQLMGSGATIVTTDAVPDENWAESWKQFFKPRRVGDSFLILPSWEVLPADCGDRIVISLDPGQAFGTGDHATTRMCLEYVELEIAPGDTVCDVGCGSGILAIAAKKMGAENVYATEIDHAAAAVAAENFERNEVDVTLYVTGSIPDEVPDSDVVFSNLVSAFLIRKAPEVSRILETGGRWIISGVIPDNFPDVAQAASRSGFRLRDRKEEDGWIAACFVKE